MRMSMVTAARLRWTATTPEDIVLTASSIRAEGGFLIASLGTTLVFRSQGRYFEVVATTLRNPNTPYVGDWAIFETPTPSPGEFTSSDSSPESMGPWFGDSLPELVRMALSNEMGGLEP